MAVCSVSEADTKQHKSPFYGQIAKRAHPSDADPAEIGGAIAGLGLSVVPANEQRQLGSTLVALAVKRRRRRFSSSRIPDHAADATRTARSYSIPAAQLTSPR
jgi:hypothetical protein